MRNILINWVLPTTRQLGGPLPVSEIKFATIELSGDAGASFAPVGDFPPPQLSVPVADLPFSDQYIVRGRVEDITDQPGAYVEVPFTVDDNSPPGVLVITVDLT